MTYLYMHVFYEFRLFLVVPDMYQIYVLDNCIKLLVVQTCIDVYI